MLKGCNLQIDSFITDQMEQTIDSLIKTGRHAGFILLMLSIDDEW